MIVMGEVRKYELRVPDLDAHDVVNNPRLLDVPQVYQINTQLLADGWFHDIANKPVKFIVVELHGDETIVSFELASFFLFVLFPPFESKINAHECCAIKSPDIICDLDETALHQLIDELHGEFTAARKLANGFTRLGDPVPNLPNEVHRLYCGAN